MALATARRPSAIPWAALHSHTLKAGDRAISAAHSGSALKQVMRIEGHRLVTPGQDFLLSDFDRIVVLGAGKAVVPMARTVGAVLGDRVAEGLIIAPESPEAQDLPHIRVLGGDHPVPGANSFRSTLALLAAARRAAVPRTLVLVLITGGASALMSYPQPGLEGEAKAKIVDQLVRSGAPIGAINTVRRHLSLIKGGRLAACMTPATIITFAVSDVPGGHPHDIGSGPTVPDPTVAKDAEDVLWKYLHPNDFIAARETLGKPNAETLKPDDDPGWEDRFHVIADNDAAREAAAHSLKERGYRVLTLEEDLSGDVDAVAERLMRVWRSHLRESGPGAALVAGGETALRVVEGGQGGRNHELALRVARAFAGDSTHQIFMSVGTDGQDGNSGAAGAIVDPATLERAAAAGLDPDDAARRHDTAPFFATLGDQITAGATCTNVMDVMVFASSGS